MSRQRSGSGPPKDGRSYGDGGYRNSAPLKLKAKGYYDEPGYYTGPQGYPGTTQPGFPIAGGQSSLQPQGVSPPQPSCAGNVVDRAAVGQWGLPTRAQTYDHRQPHQHSGDSHGQASVDSCYSSSHSGASDKKSQVTDDADRKRQSGYSKSSDKLRSSSFRDDRASSHDGHPHEDPASSHDSHRRDARISSLDSHACGDQTSSRDSLSRDGDGKKSEGQKSDGDWKTGKLSRLDINALLQNEKVKNILFAKWEQSLKTTDKKLENYASTDDSSSRYKAQQSAQTSSDDVPQKSKPILKRKTAEDRVHVESKVSSDSFSNLSALEKTLYLLCGKTNVQDVVRGSEKGSRGSEKPSIKPAGALGQLESYNDSGDDNEHAEKDTKMQTKTKKNAPSTQPFWSVDAVPTGKEKGKDSELPHNQEQLYEKWIKSINSSSKVHQATSKEQDVSRVNQLFQQTVQSHNLASSSQAKKAGDNDDEELDSTVQNILQSIGFSFDLSKTMEELARQKKRQDVLHTGMINQSASFLEQSEGLVQDVRAALFSDKQKKAQLYSLTKEARASTQKRPGYERSASGDTFSAETHRGKNSYGHQGENPERDNGRSRMSLESHEIRSERPLENLKNQDWEQINPDEDEMGGIESRKIIKKTKRLPHEKHAEIRHHSSFKETDAALPAHDKVLLDAAWKSKNVPEGNHEKSPWLSERFKDVPKDEYIYPDVSQFLKAAALLVALSSKRKEISNSGSKPLQSQSACVENPRVTSSPLLFPVSKERRDFSEKKSFSALQALLKRSIEQNAPGICQLLGLNVDSYKSPLSLTVLARPNVGGLPASKRAKSPVMSDYFNRDSVRKSPDRQTLRSTDARTSRSPGMSRSPERHKAGLPDIPMSRSPCRRKSRSPDKKKSASLDRRKSRSPANRKLVAPDRRKSRSHDRHLSRSPDRRNSRLPDRIKSKSPNRQMSRSPVKWKSRSPGLWKSGSPGRRFSRSPDRRTSISPSRRRSRSYDRRRSRSPDRRRSRSPDRCRSRSPDRRRSRSQDSQRSRLPDRHRSRSPDRRRSRSPDRRRSRSQDSQRSRLPDRHRSRSPDRHRSRSPDRRRSRSQDSQRSRLPDRHRSRSPDRRRSRSPDRRRSRSQDSQRSRLPDRHRSRSPDRRRSRSPDRRRSRSQDSQRSRLPDRHRSRWPDRRRSRSPDRHRSRSPVRPRSRSPDRRRSRSPDRRRSRSPDKCRSRSSKRLRGRSVEHRKSRSPVRLKARSPVRTRPRSAWYRSKPPGRRESIFPGRHRLQSTCRRRSSSPSQRKITSAPKVLPPQTKPPMKGKMSVGQHYLVPEVNYLSKIAMTNDTKLEVDILEEIPFHERKIIFKKRLDPQVSSTPGPQANEEQVYYNEYYDSGNHCCHLCSLDYSTVEQILFHYRDSETHHQMFEKSVKPWERAEVKDMKSKVGLPRRREIKGAEMIILSVVGYYCSVCREFCCSVVDAVEHLKTDSHYDKYMRQDTQVSSTPGPQANQEQVYYYEYYDNGNHWCHHCSLCFSTARQLICHNNSWIHRHKFGNSEKPWRSAEVKHMSKVGSPRRREIKGSEMMCYVVGHYCDMCQEFCGSVVDAVEHLKTDSHYDKYMKYVNKDTESEDVLLQEKTGVNLNIAPVQLTYPQHSLKEEKHDSDYNDPQNASRNVAVKATGVDSDSMNGIIDKNDQDVFDVKCEKKCLTIQQDIAQLDQVHFLDLVETFEFLEIPMPEESPLLDIIVPKVEDLDTEPTFMYTVISPLQVREEEKESTDDEKGLMGMRVDVEVEKPMSTVLITHPSLTQTPDHREKIISSDQADDIKKIKSPSGQAGDSKKIKSVTNSAVKSQKKTVPSLAVKWQKDDIVTYEDISEDEVVLSQDDLPTPANWANLSTPAATSHDHAARFSAISCMMEGTDIPADSGMTEKTDIPAVSGMTEETDIPAGSGMTEETDIPAVSGMTEETDLPAVSGMMEGADIPAGSLMMEGTDIPAVSSTTEGTDIPAVSSTTEGTDIPAVSSTTEGTDIPAGSGMMEGTDIPAVSSTTEGTDILAGNGMTEGTDILAGSGMTGN